MRANIGVRRQSPGSPAGQPRWGGSAAATALWILGRSRVRTASGSDRIIFHLSFSIFHLPLLDTAAYSPKCH